MCVHEVPMDEAPRCFGASNLERKVVRSYDLAFKVLDLKLDGVCDDAPSRADLLLGFPRELLPRSKPGLLKPLDRCLLLPRGEPTDIPTHRSGAADGRELKGGVDASGMDEAEPEEHACAGGEEDCAGVTQGRRCATAIALSLGEGLIQHPNLMAPSLSLLIPSRPSSCSLTRPLSLPSL
mmetsp:Transcript_23904/g.57879  ORF Transcript_23904/g.57879 Transcript_23904/m.57879 type:complete len:180 (+) Transcript_23904:929-1468(+)